MEKQLHNNCKLALTDTLFVFCCFMKVVATFIYNIFTHAPFFFSHLTYKCSTCICTVASLCQAPTNYVKLSLSSWNERGREVECIWLLLQCVGSCQLHPCTNLCPAMSHTHTTQPLCQLPRCHCDRLANSKPSVLRRAFSLILSRICKTLCKCGEIIPLVTMWWASKISWFARQILNFGKTPIYI